MNFDWKSPDGWTLKDGPLYLVTDDINSDADMVSAVYDTKMRYELTDDMSIIISVKMQGEVHNINLRELSTMHILDIAYFATESITSAVTTYDYPMPKTINNHYYYRNKHMQNGSITPPYNTVIRLNQITEPYYSAVRLDFHATKNLLHNLITSDYGMERKLDRLFGAAMAHNYL